MNGDPWEVLDVAPSVDDAALRQRYLELVRQHPPDQCPEKFAEIRAAYDQLRDPVSRLKRELFESENHDSLESIIAEVRRRVRGARIPAETLLSLGDS
jgi:curved DNA-binding protein CbpA